MAITLNTQNYVDPVYPATSAISVSVTLSGVKTGDLITVTIAAGSGATTFTVNDNVNSGNYTAANTQWVYTDNGSTGQTFYYPNSAAGNITITGTWGGAGEIIYAIFAQAWSGAATSNPQDTIMTSELGTTTSANPTASVSNITPAQNGEVILGFLVSSLNVVPTPGTNYTMPSGLSTGLMQVFPQWWIQTTATPTNAPWTQASSDWNCQMCAFKAAPVLFAGSLGVLGCGNS